MKRFAGALFLLSALSLTACPGTPVSTTGSPNPAPVPENTFAPVATASLGQGRIADLTLRKQGSEMSGILVVRTADAGTQQLTKTIALGSYALVGTFTLPRGFSMSGTFPPPVGAFTVGGQFPTLTEPGTATLSVNGETVTIPLPALNTLPTPESTLAPSPTPMATALPTALPSASPSSARVWTEAEIEAIVKCFNDSFNPKDPPSIGAYASAGSRFNAYKATKNEVGPAVYQERLNALGQDSVRLNNQYHFSCIPK